MCPNIQNQSCTIGTPFHFAIPERPNLIVTLPYHDLILPLRDIAVLQVGGQVNAVHYAVRWYGLTGQLGECGEQVHLSADLKKAGW